LRCPKVLIEKFDEIQRIWEASVARCKAFENGASSSGKGGTTSADVIVICDEDEDV
jgi:hypothetical protein